MKSVRISIVIPVYNAEAFLDKCLSSISGQDMLSYEVILVDDGSTDSSPLVCDRFSATDPRFKTIHKPNGGVSSARNAGIDIADGEYIMFVDSDDALAPGALSALDKVMSSLPDMIVGGFNVYNEGIFYGDTLPKETKVYWQGAVAEFLEDTMIGEGMLYRGPWAKLYRTSIIRKNSLKFKESLSYAEDKLFVYEYLAHVTSGAAVNVPVYEYYRRSGSLSGGKTTERRVGQLLEVVPLCADALYSVISRYPDLKSLRKVYHFDIVCHDLMRILRYFMKHRTSLLTDDSLLLARRIMDNDAMLKIFGRRVPGQMIFSLLHSTGSVTFEKSVYKTSSAILHFFYD